MAKADEDESKVNDEEEVLDDDQSQEDDSQEDLQDEEEQEEEQQEEGDEESEEESDEEEKEEKVSRREALRVEALLKKYGTPEERKEASERAGIDFSEDLDADEDTIKSINERTKKHGTEEYNRGLETAKFLNWNTNLKIETPIVHQKHKQMEDERIRNAINAKYLNFVGYDQKTSSVRLPEVSYEEFVDAEFEQASAIAELMTEKARRTAKTQASRTALRPDGSSAKSTSWQNVPLDKMTDAQLAAYGKSLGFEPPQK